MVRISMVLICLFVFAGAAHAVNPLRIPTRADYPAEIMTVGEAAHYLIEPRGYKLTLAESDARNIAARQIRPQARLIEPVALEDALLLLAGDDVLLLVDHKNKLISFGLMKGGK